MSNPVVHFELRATDAPALQRFYGELFGWSMLPHPEPGVARVESGDDHGMTGSIGPLAADGDPRLTIFVKVDDLDACLERVAAEGGTVLAAPVEVPHGPRIAQVADPAGNVIGVAHGGGREQYERFRAAAGG